MKLKDILSTVPVATVTSIMSGLAFLATAGLAASPLAAQEQTAEIIRGVSYVGVSVSDLDASTKLYSGSASLEEVAQHRLENNGALDELAGRKGVVAESRLLKSTNSQLRFMQFADQGPADTSPIVPVYGPGIAHVCFQSDGHNKTYEKFLAQGVTPVGAKEMVVLAARNPVVYAYARDADGTMFEVEHIDVSKVEALAEGFYRIRHVSLGTPDIERAIAFYSVLLANQQARQIGGKEGFAGEQFDQVSGEPGTRMRMAWFQVRNLELELAQYLSHPTEVPTEPRPLSAHGYNMIVFDVTDLDAARKLLVEAGGTVASKVHPMDGGNIFYGRDLDGNLLGFLNAPTNSIISSQGFKKP